MKLRCNFAMTLAATLILIVGPSFSSANICGTDYQNFNPTTSGIDFVTVHSSETIEPCYINTGFFMNYAVNSLAYSRTVGQFIAGTKPGDKLTSLDFNVGTGLTKNWDVGLSFPYVLEQKTDSAQLVSFFDSPGLTEVRLNTKYRFSGDEKGGWASVLSVNNNLIKNNPYTGSDSGPTTNLELVYDRSFENWGLGVNFGYRKRNPGAQIPTVPIAPLGDQYIYSLGFSRHLPAYDSKFIFEIVGSRFAVSSNIPTDRDANSLEWIGGAKFDYNRSVAIHLGGGTKIADALASPDWRIYAGINWAIGPVCEQKAYSATNEGKITRYNVAVLFETNSAEIEPGFFPKLDLLIETLRLINLKKIVVEGHTDSQGSDLYNLALSQKRADSVRRYLIKSLQISESTVTAEGYGKDRPIADNGNYQGRVKNRRVEILIEE